MNLMIDGLIHFLSRPLWLIAQADVADSGAASAADAASSPASTVADGGAADGRAADVAGDVLQNAAENAPAAEGFLTQFFGNPLNLILISGILFVMLVLRPQQRQMKELQKTLAGLKKNDRVVTASGIHGTVVQANSGESVVVIRIDENSGARMTVNRETITKVLDETKE